MGRNLEAYKAYMTDAAKEFCELIGMEATIALIEHYGGTIIQIGRCPGQASLATIAAIVGEEAARRLGKAFNGMPFTVPTCERVVKVKRNDDVRAEYDRLTKQENLSSRQAVHRLTRFTNPRLHERTIWRILNKAEG